MGVFSSVLMQHWAHCLIVHTPTSFGFYLAACYKKLVIQLKVLSLLAHSHIASIRGHARQYSFFAYASYSFIALKILECYHLLCYIRTVSSMHICLRSFTILIVSLLRSLTGSIHTTVIIRMFCIIDPWPFSNRNLLLRATRRAHNPNNLNVAFTKRMHNSCVIWPLLEFCSFP